MTFNEAEFNKTIENLPGEDGWWHPSNGDTFKRVGLNLIHHGISTNQAIDILSELFYAVKDEYGD